MPKKFSINPKAQAAKEKETEKKETAKIKKKQKEEEEYWKETDKNVLQKLERQRQKELEEENKRKRQEEKKQLYESEMNSIESTIQLYIDKQYKGAITKKQLKEEQEIRFAQRLQNVDLGDGESENEEDQQEQIEQQDDNQFLQQNQQEQQINLDKLQEIWDSDQEDFDDTIGKNENHILREQQKRDKEKYEQIIDADGINQFIDAIDGKGPQQMKFKEYCRQKLGKVQKENPQLRHSQIMEMIYKQVKVISYGQSGRQILQILRTNDLQQGIMNLDLLSYAFSDICLRHSYLMQFQKDVKIYSKFIINLMGLCESRETDHKSSQGIDSFIKSSHCSKNQLSYYTNQGNCLPCKYETVILQDNLKTIAEESIIESYNQLFYIILILIGRIQQDRQTQYQSTTPSPQPLIDKKQVTQQIPLIIQNPAETWSLQTHAIKNGGMYEVSVGKECIGTYEEWEFILNHDGPIVNQDRFVLRHLLTQTLLVAEETLQGEYKVGSIVSKTIKDQVIWQIEIGTDILCENTYVKFRHGQSKLYLSRTNENGSMENHRKVALTKFDPINSFWLVKLK